MNDKNPKSSALFEQAKKMIPGGVNSPVRAFRGVGGTPLFIKRGDGATITDVDGREYIDYVGSWGPMILGHAHPQVIAAIQEAASPGHELRRADRTGDRTRGRGDRCLSLDRNGAADFERHRGDDVRASRRARIHWQTEDR